MHCWSLEGFYCPMDKLFCEWRKPLCSHSCGTLLQTVFGLFDLGSVFWLMQVTLLLDLIFLKEDYRVFKRGLSWCWEGWWSGFQLSMLSLCCQPKLDLVPQSRSPRLPQMMEPGVCVPVTSTLLFILRQRQHCLHLLWDLICSRASWIPGLEKDVESLALFGDPLIVSVGLSPNSHSQSTKLWKCTTTSLVSRAGKHSCLLLGASAGT